MDFNDAYHLTNENCSCIIEIDNFHQVNKEAKVNIG